MNVEFVESDALWDDDMADLPQDDVSYSDDEFDNYGGFDDEEDVPLAAFSRPTTRGTRTQGSDGHSHPSPIQHTNVFPSNEEPFPMPERSGSPIDDLYGDEYDDEFEEYSPDRMKPSAPEPVTPPDGENFQIGNTLPDGPHNGGSGSPAVHLRDEPPLISPTPPRISSSRSHTSLSSHSSAGPLHSHDLSRIPPRRAAAKSQSARTRKSVVLPLRGTANTRKPKTAAPGMLRRSHSVTSLYNSRTLVASYKPKSIKLTATRELTSARKRRSRNERSLEEVVYSPSNLPQISPVKRLSPSARSSQHELSHGPPSTRPGLSHVDVVAEGRVRDFLSDGGGGASPVKKHRTASQREEDYDLSLAGGILAYDPIADPNCTYCSTDNFLDSILDAQELTPEQVHILSMRRRQQENRPNSQLFDLSQVREVTEHNWDHLVADRSPSKASEMSESGDLMSLQAKIHRLWDDLFVDETKQHEFLEKHAGYDQEVMDAFAGEIMRLEVHRDIIALPAQLWSDREAMLQQIQPGVSNSGVNDVTKRLLDAIKEYCGLTGFRNYPIQDFDLVARAFMGPASIDQVDIRSLETLADIVDVASWIVARSVTDKEMMKLQSALTRCIGRANRRNKGGRRRR